MPRYNTRYAVTIESAKRRKESNLQNGFIICEPTVDALRRELFISKMRKCEVDRIRYKNKNKKTDAI